MWDHYILGFCYTDQQEWTLYHKHHDSFKVNIMGLPKSSKVVGFLAHYQVQLWKRFNPKWKHQKPKNWFEYLLIQSLTWANIVSSNIIN